MEALEWSFGVQLCDTKWEVTPSSPFTPVTDWASVTDKTHVLSVLLMGF